MTNQNTPTLDRLHAQAQPEAMRTIIEWQKSAYHADLALKAINAAKSSPNPYRAEMYGNDARYDAVLAVRHALKALDFPFSPVENAGFFSGFYHHEI